MSTDDRIQSQGPDEPAPPNDLAKRMARFTNQAKGTSPRTLFLYGLVALLAVAVVFYWYRSRQDAREANTQLWLRLDNGSGVALQDLARRQATARTPQGKGARLQLAWSEYWNDAMRIVTKNPKEAIEKLKRAEKEYESVREESKNDPFILPEALYALAAIKETRTIESKDLKSAKDNLEAARELYRGLIKSHQDSGYAQLAQKRLEALDDEAKLETASNFYVALGTRRPPAFDPGDFGDFMPGQFPPE